MLNLMHFQDKIAHLLLFCKEASKSKKIAFDLE